MNLALGIACIWVGCAMIWLASHPSQASTPWAAFQEVLGAINRGAEEPS